MARIPNAENALIDDAKISEYLLNPDHPSNGGKADYFLRFGFSAGRTGTMAAALLQHARDGELDEVGQTPFGTEYAIEGPLRTPDGRNPLVRTVWLWRTGEPGPHLVTAYPSERSSR